MNRSSENYNLLSLIGSSEDFRLIMDTANAKYNNTAWKAFADVLPASNSKKFSTIVDETGIIVKASVIGPTGKKPLRSVEGGAGYGDSLHKIGHGFKVDQSDINHIKELNLVDTAMATRMMEKYLNRASNLIGGFHATWNSWIYQALSKTTVTLESLGGSPVTVDLHVPTANKLKAKGDKGWFESSTTASIANDLVRMNKVADDLGMPADRVYLCSKTLYDKIMQDEKILSIVKGSMPLATVDTYLSPRRVASLLPGVLDIPAIAVIDEKSRHEVDGVAVDSDPSFDENIISLVPMSRLFDMHNSPSDYVDDRNPATVKSSTENGLIGGIQLFHSEPIEVITNMEAWGFFTFKNPKYIVTLDSSKASTNGK